VIVSAVYQALAHRHPNSRSHDRPGFPAEVVLRLLILKHGRKWSYAVPEHEVRANLVYRDFTRVGAPFGLPRSPRPWYCEYQSRSLPCCLFGAQFQQSLGVAERGIVGPKRRTLSTAERIAVAFGECRETYDAPEIGMLAFEGIIRSIL
jgi:hypothetical protein